MDQVVASYPFVNHCRLNFSDYVQLVVTGEDQDLVFLQFDLLGFVVIDPIGGFLLMDKFVGNSSSLQFWRYANGERKSKYQSAFLIYLIISRDFTGPSNLFRSL